MTNWLRNTRMSTASCLRVETSSTSCTNGSFRRLWSHWAHRARWETMSWPNTWIRLFWWRILISLISWRWSIKSKMLKMTSKGSLRESLPFCRTTIKSTSRFSSTSSSKSSTRFNHSKARFQISFTSLRNRQLDILEQEQLKPTRWEDSTTSELTIRESWALVINKYWGNMYKERMVRRAQMKILKVNLMMRALRSPDSVVRCLLQRNQWSRRISRRSPAALGWTRSESETMVRRA